MEMRMPRVWGIMARDDALALQRCRTYMPECSGFLGVGERSFHGDDIVEEGGYC